MDREDKWVDPMKRLIEEHEHVSELLDYMGEIKVLLLNHGNGTRVEPITEFLKENVAVHIAFEEDVVFPALLSSAATPEIRELISELQREHEDILKYTEEFKSIVSENDFLTDNEAKSSLNTLIQKIFDCLLSHSSVEDEKLLPVVKENLDLFQKHDTA